MMHDEPRDYIMVEDDLGNRKEFAVEALFDMNDESYALLTAADETVIMKIEEEEGNQYLVGLSNRSESEALLAAYEIAVEHAPAE